jgi:hypothetical protein
MKIVLAEVNDCSWCNRRGFEVNKSKEYSELCLHCGGMGRTLTQVDSVEARKQYEKTKSR